MKVRLIAVLITVIVVIGMVAFTIYQNAEREEKNFSSESENLKEEQTQREIGIDINSNIVKNVYKKVVESRNFIYKYVNIESGKVPNELKLRMAYANMPEESGIELGETYFLETGQSYAYTEEQFSESLKNILGKGTRFENEDFTADVSRFGALPEFIYNSENNRYETNFEFGGGVGGYVIQSVTSATTQGNYLNLYVKPVFMKGIGEGPGVFLDDVCEGYADYNYETDTFSNKVVNGGENVEIEKLELNIYKYVFVKQGEDYYFDSLEKIK